MNIKLENIFLFLVVVTDFAKIVSSLDSKCPPLRLLNGRLRYRWRGRSVRFNCMKGYQLVGVKYATCMNGKWDTEVPICAKYGCRVPSTNHINGQFIESYRGAVVKIVCNPGYMLVGSPSVYCNGYRWNETFPTCRVKNSNPALSCDFESPDLCGWSQDPMHDFDWKRRDWFAPSVVASTGVALNKSAGEGHYDFYMSMESSSPRTENDTARLYSPVYPSKYSKGTCFKFMYHMNATTGILKVYVKPEEVELFDLIPSSWLVGDHGNSWVENFFQIEPMETSFQIVIEGMRGSDGDITFDDVKLTSPEECKNLQAMSSTETLSTTANPDYVRDYSSCKSRCNQERGEVTTPALNLQVQSCNCDENCDRDGTCCFDYFDFCSPFQFSSSASTSASSAEAEVEWSSPASTFPSKVPTPESEPEPSSPKLTPSHHFNNESNEIDPKKPVERIDSERATHRTPEEIPKRENRLRPWRGKAEEKTKTTTPQTRPRVPIAKEVTERTTMKPGQRKVIDAKLAKPDVNKTKTNGTAKEIRPKVGAKPETKSVSVTSPLSTTTAKVFKESFYWKQLEKPSNADSSNGFRFNKGKQKEVSGKEPPQAIKIDKTDDNNGGTVRGIVEVGSAAIAILVIIILGIFWYRRREHRKAERENMVEDSDVRFLTSDEALDFTLARPADDDL